MIVLCFASSFEKGKHFPMVRIEKKLMCELDARCKMRRQQRKKIIHDSINAHKCTNVG